VRGLPGILDSGLWPALDGRGPGPTRALVTDIGNDLAYGAAPADLAAWVAGCVERLAGAGADIVLTLLPARSLAQLAPWQYHLVKAVMFPGRRLPFRALHDRVREVNDRLAALAASTGATGTAPVKLVEPSAHWYGADRIHVRRRQHARVWDEILSRWDRAAARDPASPPPVPRLRLAPECRTVLGVTVRRRQPSLFLADGTPVSFY
jgi:hypothetical protein